MTVVRPNHGGSHRPKLGAVEGEFAVTAGRRVVVHSYLAPRAGRYAASHLIELPDRLMAVDLPLLAPLTAEVLRRAADLAKPLTEVFVTSSGPSVDREVPPATSWFGGVPLLFSWFRIASETEHLVLELPDEGLLMTGDLVSNGVHPRLARHQLTGWTAALRQLRARTTAVVLPGHGPPGGADLIEGMLRYLEVAQFVLAGNQGDDETAATLRRTFPDHREAWPPDD
jgi:hypothetical protein